MVKDWTRTKEKLSKLIGVWAQIDWADPDYFLGTSVKRIFFYQGVDLIGSEPFSETRVKMLRREIPVVDLTEGRPLPPHFIELPRRIIILGRLNLAELPW